MTAYMIEVAKNLHLFHDLLHCNVISRLCDDCLACNLLARQSIECQMYICEAPA